MPNSLQLHRLQHTRLPCPSTSPGACSNSCPLSQWCYPTISSSVIPFSSWLQSFPAPWSFLMSQLFISCSQSIGALVSVSVLPVNIQCWFSLYGLVWSPCCPRLEIICVFIIDWIQVTKNFKNSKRNYSLSFQLWYKNFKTVALSFSVYKVKMIYL